MGATASHPPPPVRLSAMWRRRPPFPPPPFPSSTFRSSTSTQSAHLPLGCVWYWGEGRAGPKRFPVICRRSVESCWAGLETVIPWSRCAGEGVDYGGMGLASLCHSLRQITGEIKATHQARKNAGRRPRTPWTLAETLALLHLHSVDLQEGPPGG